MAMMKKQTSHELGQQAEAYVLQYLQKQGLKLITKNYEPPGRGMADLDLVMQSKDKTLIFVEVKARKNSDFGGAAASVSLAEQQRLVLSAQHFLMQLRVQPACRFDIVLLEGAGWEKQEPTWLKGAFC